MTRDHTRIAPLALLCAGLIATPALGAPGRLLDKSGEVSAPSVFVTGGQQRATGFIVRVPATPNERVEVRWEVSCAVEGKGRFRIGEFSMPGRAQRRLKITTARPDECIANALVGYEEGFEGRIRVELFGRSR